MKKGQTRRRQDQSSTSPLEQNPEGKKQKKTGSLRKHNGRRDISLTVLVDIQPRWGIDFRGELNDKCTVQQDEWILHRMKNQ